MESDSPQKKLEQPMLQLDGLAGAPGLATGRAVVFETRRHTVVRKKIAFAQIEDESARYLKAVEQTARELQDVASRARGGHVEASILQAYVLMVLDETLKNDVLARIARDQFCAEWALDLAAEQMAAQLAQSPDPYLAERSHDVEFVGDRILSVLSGYKTTVALPDGSDPVVIVAHDLSPAEIAGLSHEKVCAIVTEVGTRTSHTAIVARALEIPAVVGVTGAISRINSHELVVVDGLRGRVIVSPSEAMRKAADTRAERYSALTRELRELRHRPAATKCGAPVYLRGNIEFASEVDVALAHGAEGIGLYRTEFLYINRTDLPSEDEQFEIYRRVIEAVAPLPVILRTFDLGGDKLATSLIQGPTGPNPALGIRAVRLGLLHPELLMTQLRAMIRASAYGRLGIMIPMVATLGEFRAVQKILAQTIDGIDDAGIPRAGHLPLGCMIELPSAALMSSFLAKEAAFMSIGTNDLMQYCLGVDRGRRELAHLASPFEPAVLRLIQLIVAAGESNKRRVQVCGAMASDPLAVLLLVGLGVREFSMESVAIPEIKEALSRITVSEVEKLAHQALALSTAEDIERMVTEAYAPYFADLLDGGQLF